MLSPSLDWKLASTRWASELNPFLSNLLNQVQLLEKVNLSAGNTSIPHKLGRMMKGWFLIDIQGPAQIYRNGPFSDKTLILNSSVAVTVNIGVF